MEEMKSMIKPAIIIAIGIAILVIVGIFKFSSDNKTIIGKGMINKLDTMVELCTIDFYNEVAVVDTVENWECFAKQKQRGSISFDIENLEINTESDTVSIILPPEIIEIMEATDKESWDAIDSKDLNGSWDNASPDIWNVVKRNALKNSTKNLYKAGIVERARIEGAQNLQSLMEKVYRKPVKVIDPTPNGAHYGEYR